MNGPAIYRADVFQHFQHFQKPLQMCEKLKTGGLKPFVVDDCSTTVVPGPQRATYSQC